MDTLGRFLFHSLPNVLTIFLGIALFCSLYPLKKRAAAHALECLACCIALSCASTLVNHLMMPGLALILGEYLTWLPTTVFFALVLVACLPLARATFEMKGWDAVFCCTAGYIVQNCSHLLWSIVQAVCPGVGAWPDWAQALGFLAVAGVVFAAVRATAVRTIRDERLEGEGDWRTILVLFGVIAVNIASNTILQRMQSSGILHPAQFLGLALSFLTMSLLTLVLDFEILFTNRMRENAAALRQIMEDERRQYRISSETIEAINVRCHDIKHQIRNLSRSADAPADYLEKIDGLVSIYDAGINTGNKALDVILTEKNLVCRSKDIELTAVVDGGALGFMSEEDIYSLFGNALDNAIEASEKLQDPELRLIDVAGRKVGEMVSIQVRNYCAEEPVVEDGALLTTKADAALHGFGTKSIKLVAERYGGSCSFDASDGIFRLLVLLPIPDEEM